MIQKKRIFYRCISIAISALVGLQSFAQSPGNSRAYYVSSSGDDINPGTKMAPFKTVDKVNSLHLVAGDTVYFRSGEVFNGSLLITNETTGTPNNPIVITSYGGTYATINAKD